MTQSLRQLPHPQGSLLLGNTLDFARDPLAFLTHCAYGYGEIIPLRLLFSPACLLTNPMHIEQVLKEREVFIKNTPAWRAVQTLVGEGLLTSEGDFWARQRRLTQPVFHQQRITAYGEIMVSYADRLMQTWQEGEVRDIHADMMRLTLNIVTKTLFDVDVTGGEAQAVAHALEAAMEWFSSQRKQGFLRLPWVSTEVNRRYKAALQTMDDAIYQLIQQRRSSGENPGDLLSMLLNVRDEADGSRMTDQQLRDELTTLILAGHETTANALSWAWMLLSQYAHVRSQLQTELKTVLGDRPPTIADLPQLKYTQQIIKEVLRLYPPLFSLARSPICDYELDGYLLPAGCIVLFSPWVMHRHPRYFDQPDAFCPERWTEEFEKQLPRCAYFPFGEGPRICIGKAFAQMESALLLAAIAQRFQLNLVADEPIEPLPSMTLRPKHGIQMQLQYTQI